MQDAADFSECVGSDRLVMAYSLQSLRINSFVGQTVEGNTVLFHKFPHRTKRDRHCITPVFDYYRGLAIFHYSDYNHYNGGIKVIVTFCGHSQISQCQAVERWLYGVTQELITRGATTFYLGGYGAFDNLAASVLRRQKMQYPQIELVLVMAYLNDGRDASGYDRTIYPPLETVPRRYAIPRRNRWMVQSSDIVVAYVLHDWGGAAATLRFAIQKKKQILSYCDEVGS